MLADSCDKFQEIGAELIPILVGEGFALASDGVNALLIKSGVQMEPTECLITCHGFIYLLLLTVVKLIRFYLNVKRLFSRQSIRLWPGRKFPTADASSEAFS